jgi:hypothetical protein
MQNKEVIVKKFKHWLNDLQVLALPEIASSLFFATRRSSSAFYNPLVAFRNINKWIGSVLEYLEENPEVAQLLTPSVVGDLKIAYNTTLPENLHDWKENTPAVKSLAHLRSFIALHLSITNALFELEHRMQWLLEHELSDKGG